MVEHVIRNFSPDQYEYFLYNKSLKSKNNYYYQISYEDGMQPLRVLDCNMNF